MKKKEIDKRISDCIRLKSSRLYLSNLGITDLKNLEQLRDCKHITQLYLGGNQISKIENLDSNTKLTYLFISNNKISKIENLDSLTNLSHLFLFNNQISKIEGLENNTSLIMLNLSNNKISKIENLENNTRLSSFSLSDNKISTIWDVLNIKNFNHIYLGIDKNPLEKKHNLILKDNESHLNVIKNLISQYDFGSSKKNHENNYNYPDDSDSRISIIDSQAFVGRSLKNNSIKNIFICYSSKDLEYKNILLDFLHNPIKNKKINVWHDHLIAPDEIWDDSIKSKLNNADIVIILVSQNAINSKYINEEELAITLKRHKNNEVKIFPILIKHCTYKNWYIYTKNQSSNEGTNMSKFQFFPKVNGSLKPFSKWKKSKRNKYWVKLQEKLMRVIEN